MDENEIQFSRLSLQKGDYLVIDVNTSNLTPEQMKERLTSIREDSFVRYVEEQGNSVFITYTGIKLNILRMEETDKLLVYVDVTDFPEETETEYLEVIKNKLTDHVKEEKLILMPTRNNSPVLQVKPEETE